MNEIKQKDYDGIGISFRNNPLGLPVQEAKEAFDELPIWIIGKLNELIQEYNGYTGDIQGVRIGSNGQLEYTVDGNVWYELVSANLKSGSAAGRSARGSRRGKTACSSPMPACPRSRQGERGYSACGRECNHSERECGARRRDE